MTEQDRLKLNEFILKCVNNNIVIPVIKKAFTDHLTIQQLLHEAKDETLKALFTSLKQMPVNVVSTRIKKESAEAKFYVADITAEELADIVDLIRFTKAVESEKAKLAREIALLEKELGLFETPEEKKGKIQEKLTALRQQVV